MKITDLEAGQSYIDRDGHIRRIEFIEGHGLLSYEALTGPYKGESHQCTQRHFAEMYAASAVSGENSEHVSCEAC